MMSVCVSTFCPSVDVARRKLNSFNEKLYFNLNKYLSPKLMVNMDPLEVEVITEKKKYFNNIYSEYVTKQLKRNNFNSRCILTLLLECFKIVIFYNWFLL